MKIDSIYTFNSTNKAYTDDNGKLIILYEFSDKTEYENVMQLINERKNRQTCFMSDGLYYVGEYVTDEVARYLINKNTFRKDINGNWSDYTLFYSDMQAYGDMRYYFNKTDKQFYSEFINIGD